MLQLLKLEETNRFHERPTNFTSPDNSCHSLWLRWCNCDGSLQWAGSL